jgi:tRNA dimethylallyltransferase
MAGGSGMYINAVCDSIDDIPDVDPEVRLKYIKKQREEGIESLRIALRLLDPEYYSKVDLKNPKRIIRALEICETAGCSYSSFLTKKKKTRDFEILKIGINRAREELYEKINLRVDSMIGMGLEEEAKALYDLKHFNALNSVGYKEFFEFFDGNISYEKAIELIKRNSRRFAKRQLTWWAKDKDIRWFHPDQFQEIIQCIEKNVEIITP